MATTKLKTTDLDLYGLLEILPSATPTEIKSAYRKKALSCHPDKNPDNPNAAKLFIQLSEVFAILSDEKARAAYDQTLKAKEAARARTKQLDAKRRKLKEDLERREQEAKDRATQATTKVKEDKLSSQEALQREIDRLKKEGSRKLLEEQEQMKEQIRRELQGQKESSSFMLPQPQKFKLDVKPRFKVKWSSSASYGHDKLLQIFSRYGKVSELLVLKRKALVEFAEQKDADNAFKTESSRAGSDLKLEWINQTDDSTPTPSNPSSTGSHASPVTVTNNGAPQSQSQSQPFSSSTTAPSNFAEFEAMVLANLKAAAAQSQSQNKVN